MHETARWRLSPFLDTSCSRLFPVLRCLPIPLRATFHLHHGSNAKQRPWFHCFVPPWCKADMQLGLMNKLKKNFF